MMTITKSNVISIGDHIYPLKFHQINFSLLVKQLLILWTDSWFVEHQLQKKLRSVSPLECLHPLLLSPYINIDRIVVVLHLPSLSIQGVLDTKSSFSVTVGRVSGVLWTPVSSTNKIDLHRYTVKAVYKGHSKEHENVVFMSSCPLYTG